MKAFETSTTVQSEGQVYVPSVPFAPGTEVEVTINPKRKSAAEFAQAWKQICDVMRHERRTPPTDDEIQHEIDAHRAGQ